MISGAGCVRSKVEMSRASRFHEEHGGIEWWGRHPEEHGVDDQWGRLREEQSGNEQGKQVP